MLEWLIDRIIEASQKEKQCWECIPDGEDTGYFLVTDLPRIRFYPRSHRTMVSLDHVRTVEFRLFGERNKEMALRWIDHQSLRYGIIYALQFWRKEP